MKVYFAACSGKIFPTTMNPRVRLFESKSTTGLAAAILLALGMTVLETAALSLTAPGSGLWVRLEPTSGLYEIASSHPAWTFAGHIPAPLAKAAASRGTDRVGAYQQVSFEWQADEIPMTGWIRLYDEPALALFSQTVKTATGTPPSAFPDFTKLPADLHVFSYGLQTFSPPQFAASETGTPWLLFDDHANAFIISPASHFMVASMLGDGRQRVASGFNPRLRICRRVSPKKPWSPSARASIRHGICGANRSSNWNRPNVPPMTPMPC